MARATKEQNQKSIPSGVQKTLAKIENRVGDRVAELMEKNLDGSVPRVSESSRRRRV